MKILAILAFIGLGNERVDLSKSLVENVHLGFLRIQKGAFRVDHISQARLKKEIVNK